MSQPAVEAIIRRRKHQRLRNMTGGISRWIQSNWRRCGSVCMQAGAGFLLSFADLAGIPSGFGAAWLAACAVQGTSMLLPVIGCLLAFPMRLLWGLEPRWHMLLTLAMMLPAQRMLFGRSTLRMMLWTAIALLPGLIGAWLGGTQREVLVAAASMAISALAAPIMYRARRLLREEREIGTVEEYLAIGYAAALLLCGGARMLLPGVNLGVLGAGFLTLQAALLFGAGAGCMTGLIGGATLALQGIPLGLSVCLAMGGFLAGLTNQSSRRVVPCLCFAMASALAMYLGGPMIHGDVGAPVAAALLTLLAPAPCREALQAFGMRFGRRQEQRDAYASIQLERWERTVEEISCSMPAPEKAAETHAPDWWKNQLCAGCPEAEECACMATPAAAERADMVLQSLTGGAGEEALDGLRGLGCARLYHLRDSMSRHALEVREQERSVRRANYERAIQTTHLTALAGAARRFATISAAGWWDGMQGRRLAQAASELALPASLQYVRRIDGHAQTAWKIDEAADAQALGGELCALTGSVLGLPCEVARQEAQILYVAEKPLFRADAGSATRGKIDDSVQNGDIVRMGMLREGCFLAALSDGMGHGADARRESGQTVALLHLCLEAGYAREQALTVVNGMMLSATQGERFATVDMLTVDLWSGRMTLDKLGAANSYLIQGDELTCLSGDALPLGILEQASSRACEGRLADGDTLLMMSDGVEEAFSSQEALQAAIRTAVALPSAQDAAASLLDAAYRAADGAVRDDQTVVAVRLICQSAQSPAQPEQTARFARRSQRVYNRRKPVYNEAETQAMGAEADAWTGARKGSAESSGEAGAHAGRRVSAADRSRRDAAVTPGCSGRWQKHRAL